MTIKDVMTAPARTCRASDTLDTAAEIMWQADCGCVPVCEGERVVGIITDRDICMAAHFEKRPLANCQVAGVMSTTLQSCRPHDSLQKAADIMSEHQLRRLPVIDEAGRLVGIVSINDLVLRARTASRGNSTLTPEEVAATLGSISQHRSNSLSVDV